MCACRDEALRAHEDAAQKILHDNNAVRGRGAGELDLHGLHASEAIAALERHLHGVAAYRCAANCLPPAATARE